MQVVTVKDNLELIIRPAEIKDAAIILDYVNIISGESENITFGPGEFTMTVEQEKAFIQRTSETSNNTFIVGYINNELVAIADVHAGQRPRIRHSGELGISVRKKYWRHGIGREMMQYLIKWASEMGLRKLNLRVREDNLGAIALYKSLGFYEQGKITREFYIRDEFISSLHMGLEID
ncbi:MAG: GNAT family N-acetyltransferase [Candidatus Heimdallarchaeota archaeon]|nr:GNAT family N-acetyltransferase [Candidatus Heimdallarchaeota archaeon]